MNLGPYVTPELPGIGGKIKQNPADFAVEERPLYPPSGQGEHLYLLIEKEGIGTRELVEQAARLFSLSPRQIGYAGLKDKWSRCRQTISVPGISDIEALRLNGPHVRVLSAVPHRNKLRIGHLTGNRFRILIRGVAADAEARAQAVLDAVKQKGLPNYFGEQRFTGSRGNFARAGEWLRLATRRPPGWERRFRLQAYQSYIFNRYLSRRIERALLDELMLGDVAMKHDTGGLFVVEEPAREQARAAAFEISATGPLFGYKMLLPTGESRRLEEAILKAETLELALTQSPQLKRARLFGSRRAVRVAIRDARLEAVADGLQLAFELPKGSYATVLLREIMKSDVV